MDFDKIQKVFHLLGDKADKIAKESGYTGQYFDTKEYRRFERAWEVYLGGIGIERIRNSDNVYLQDDRVLVPDPLHYECEGVLMAEETAERILMLGLP